MIHKKVYNLKLSRYRFQNEHLASMRSYSNAQVPHRCLPQCLVLHLENQFKKKHKSNEINSTNMINYSKTLSISVTVEKWSEIYKPKISCNDGGVWRESYIIPMGCHQRGCWTTVHHQHHHSVFGKGSRPHLRIN